MATPKTQKPLKPIQEYATAILARREHSTTELRRKLVTKGYPRPEITTLIEQFMEKNYLNDTRYAAARARTRATQSKWGAGRIRQELAQNGIEKSLTSTTIEVLSEDHDWLATATKLLQRKFPKPIPVFNREDRSLNPQDAMKEIQKEKARRLNFLMRRGFTMSQSLTALGLSQEDALDLSE